ncbi:MAG: hypothetical protein OCD01_00425 [Fibrobacterales bacterium]
MYSGRGFSEWEIGDIDVIKHNGLYHLFHLIIPNHDYIAHAVSDNGISWRRVENAVFVGDPGSWDDDMLWTMNVVLEDDWFIMYYTGLMMEDKGAVQRIGRARSKDLYHWKKIEGNGFPLEPGPPFYEDIDDNPRGWASFRDPFIYKEGGEEYMLICARSNTGPISRRGVVALAEKMGNSFKLTQPLLHPYAYDDVECPCLFKIKDYYYLIGSIREDVKVRYWYAPDLKGEYHSFHNDVLLPPGNYAARVVNDGKHLLIYCFYVMGDDVNSHRTLPPPKELSVNDRGQLELKSYYRWELMKQAAIHQSEYLGFFPINSNPTGSYKKLEATHVFECKSGYEVFLIKQISPSFIFEGTITIEGMGKCGLVFDMDTQGNGYFLSLDCVNGLVQIRAWGFDESNPKSNFIFKNLQSNVFKVNHNNTYEFKLVNYGNYIEVSIDGIVKISLVDYIYENDYIGLYCASSKVSLHDSHMYKINEPQEEYASQRCTLADIHSEISGPE